METQLTGSHRTTYDAVFQHPIARNLTWRDVVSMLGALEGTAQEEHRETLKVERNGRTVVLHQPSRKNITDVQEVMNLRRFLEQSQAAQPQPQPASAGAHLLVVIDHHLARIYQAELHGSTAQRIIPYDREGSGRHLHYVRDDSNGQRKPEIKSYYEAVATTLQGADKILLFGSGTGASSAMDQLLAVFRRDHPTLADRVVGCVVVDEQHLSEDQLLAQARMFYENLPQQDAADGSAGCPTLRGDVGADDYRARDRRTTGRRPAH
jgi:hypothetical protein